MRATRSWTVVLLAGAVLAAGGCGGGGKDKAAGDAGPPAPFLAATALGDQFVAVVERVAPTVVPIESAGGRGSGVVYDDAGNIVTNAHVVGDFDEFDVTLSDGKHYAVSLVGSYPPEDLAVALAQRAPGERVQVKVANPDTGERRTVDVTLGELPAG